MPALHPLPKRIPLLHIFRVESFFEPVRSLLGGAVGEGVFSAMMPDASGRV